jgi:hypothetical protein
VISSGIEFHEAISLSLSLRDQGIPLKAYPMKSFTRLYETVSKFSFFFGQLFWPENLGKSCYYRRGRCDWSQNFIESEPLGACGCSTYIGLYESL